MAECLVGPLLPAGAQVAVVVAGWLCPFGEGPNPWESPHWLSGICICSPAPGGRGCSGLPTAAGPGSLSSPGRIPASLPTCGHSPSSDSHLLQSKGLSVSLWHPGDATGLNRAPQGAAQPISPGAFGCQAEEQVLGWVGRVGSPDRARPPTMMCAGAGLDLGHHPFHEQSGIKRSPR